MTLKYCIDMSNVFITGEKIDLCVPEEKDFREWAAWFNSQEVTKYLEQGKYPNTVEMQRAFYEKEVNRGRFISLIKTKTSELLGVISLSEINYEKASCQISYVCPVKSDEVRYAALEALAICTQHAFDRFGVCRVWSGHSYPGLKSWIKKTELIGYQTEGVISSGFKHGILVNDAIRTSIIKETYLDLLNRRGGRLWPGEIIVKRMLLEMNEYSPLSEEILFSIVTLQTKRQKAIKEIERNAQF
jgi:hypothetical protein